MRICILGTGVVAQTLGGKLLELGHDVTFGTRDTDPSARRLVWLEARHRPRRHHDGTGHRDVPAPLAAALGSNGDGCA
jgi:predicted dinucleotide-binding enzyme